MATETPTKSARELGKLPLEAPLLPNERVSRETVTFEAPFFVEGLGQEGAAGTFEVETLEELIEGLSFPAYRVASTSLVLPLSSGPSHSYQLVPIDPAIVRAARKAGTASVPASTDEKAESIR